MNPNSLLLLALLLCFVSPSLQISCANVQISASYFTSEIIDVKWFNNEEFVYVVTRTSVAVSQNKGETFRENSFVDGQIDALFLTTSDKRQLVISYKESTPTLWKTEDHGSTWKVSKGAENVFDIYPHPVDSSWLMAHTFTPGCIGTGTSCSYNLIFSNDFGSTWKEVQKGVRRFSWGDAGYGGVPKENCFQLRTTGERQNVFERSTNLYKSIDVTVEQVADFGYYYGNLYIAQIKNNELSLLISKDHGKTINPAKFPTTFDEKMYTIIDGISGLSYVGVQHSKLTDPVQWTNVYVTDFNSESYVLSLEYVAKGRNGKLDFLPVDIDGIQVANVYLLEEGIMPTSNSPIISVITFDNGGQWQKMQGPASLCNKGESCHIHLQGVTTGFNIETSPSAAGMIVASGNIGDVIDDEALSTFVSDDAGLTWNKIFPTEQVFRFSDHGGLLLLADEEDIDNTVKYSWNHGRDLIPCEYSTSDNVETSEIVTSPSQTSQSFLLVQYNTADESSQITHLDFSLLHEAPCSSDDFEEWKPSDGSEEDCLLGREITYHRRKASSACYNTEEYEYYNIQSTCPCTREDYGCDFCFEESEFTDSDTCNLYCAEDPTLPPKDCSSEYVKTQGYRIVPGDICTGGLNLNPLICDCKGQNCKETTPVPPDSTTGSTTGSTSGGSGGPDAGAVIGIILLVLVLSVIIVSGVIYYLYQQNDEVKEYIDEHIPKHWFGKGQSNVPYSPVDPNNVEVDPFADEEEATELGDSDLVQMKTMSPGTQDDFNPRTNDDPPSLI